MKWSDFSTKQKLYIGIPVVALGIYLQATHEPKSSQKASIIENTSRQTTVKAGQEAKIQDFILAGITKEDINEIVKASVIKDETVFYEKSLNGSAIKLEKGTAVKVIDPGVMFHEIRVMDGNFIGRTCFVPTEYISVN